MKILLKILLTPITLLVTLFIWLCAGLLSCSAFVFKIASGLLSGVCPKFCVNTAERCKIELK